MVAENRIYYYFETRRSYTIFDLFCRYARSTLIERGASDTDRSVINNSEVIASDIGIEIFGRNKIINHNIILSYCSPTKPLHYIITYSV